MGPMTEQAATTEEIRIMRRMLGADSVRPGYRNHYAARPDNEELKVMEAKGLVVRTPNSGELFYYAVTQEWQGVLGIKEIP